MLNPSKAAPRRPLRTGLSLAAGLALLCLPATQASADTAPPPDENTIQWSIGPTPQGDDDLRRHFAADVDPGAVVADSVTIANLGAEPLTLDLYATDAVNTDDGAFGLLPASEEPSGLGGWIDLEVSQVHLEPGKEVVVPFQFTVPADTTPGDHAAGIVASRLVAAADDAGAQMAVDQRVGVRLYTRVSGEITPAVTISSVELSYDGAWFPFAGGPARLDYRIENTGNVAISAGSSVSVRGPFGIDLGFTDQDAVGPILPGQQITGTVEVSGALPLGLLTAELTADATSLVDFASVDVPSASAETSAVAVPWLLLAAIAALILVLVLVWRRRRATLARRDGSPAPASMPTDERSPSPADATVTDSAGPERTPVSTGSVSVE